MQTYTSRVMDLTAAEIIYYFVCFMKTKEDICFIFIFAKNYFYQNYAHFNCEK